MKDTKRTPLIDHAQVIGLFKLDRSQDRSTLLELIGIFQASTPQHFENLDQAWADRNFRDLARIAHAMKSTSGMLGLKRMHEELTILEAAAHASNELLIFKTLKTISPIYQDSLQALQIWTIRKSAA